MEVTIPKVHDPASLYDNEIKNRKITPKAPPFAQRDKLADLRQEPEWLLPELRSWGSIPEGDRAARIQAIIKGNHEGKYKDRLLRYVLYMETSRQNAIEIVNFILPRK